MSESVFSERLEKPYRVYKLDKIDAWFEFCLTETRFVVDLRSGPIYFYIADGPAMARAINNLWVVSLDKDNGCLRDDPLRLAKTLFGAINAYQEERGLIDLDLFEKELIGFWEKMWAND